MRKITINMTVVAISSPLISVTFNAVIHDVVRERGRDDRRQGEGYPD
ncbi:hypothetical protein ACFFYR_38520 [Paraburkholderia dipogonis]